ncbi:hypothetical protein O181_021594 [Austropuccinia psidii MF-1]|uniref:Uncharacterized protein n=1 Tax=Austropuccinia psidii MF-1 TaxID=1389203 RepID=A0A9Q3CDB4_9BASI|nr:hypothetical protein [Austropuccinia psidii MF-1]
MGWGSQTGFLLKLGNTPILGGLKWQLVVALSTCAAEYIALSDSTQHLVQAINKLEQLVSDFDKVIFCDNQAVVQHQDNVGQDRQHAGRSSHQETLGANTSSSTPFPGNPVSFSSPLIIGGDGIGTDWRASFATPGPLLIGNASLTSHHWR